MPPTPGFVIPAPTISYLGRIIEDASAIELLAMITMRAQSEDELADLKSQLVKIINRLAVYAQMGDKSTHSNFH